jgi:transcriptional regulator with XRE-family HTH domain
MKAPSEDFCGRWQGAFWRGIMTLGKRIQLIRKHRKITQKELGIRIGLHEVSDKSNEKTAETRIAQYENNLKIPRQDVIDKLALALDVNPLNLEDVPPGTLDYIMQTLFWLEESSPGLTQLFVMESISWRDPTYDAEDRVVKYNDNDDWPARAPMGMYFNDIALNDFLREWHTRQEERRQGVITDKEYFEWKINWPYTTDNEGRREPPYRWRVVIES